MYLIDMFNISLKNIIGTPRQSSMMINPIGGGQYCHMGLGDGLRLCFGNINESKSIAINLNVDGVPLYKNGTILANSLQCFYMPYISPNHYWNLSWAP